MICVDLDENVEALGDLGGEATYTDAEEGDPAAIEKLEAAFTKYVPIMSTALEELRKLPLPTEDTEAVDRFLSAFERLVAQGRDDLAALRARELEGFARFGERHSRGLEVVTAAAAYGFDCPAPHAPPH